METKELIKGVLTMLLAFIVIMVYIWFYYEIL